ncbi:MAG: fumarylacetoacetate hydrolase family protein [Pseudomonadota bacterium]
MGENYAAHAVEVGRDPKAKKPVILPKNRECLTTGREFPNPAMTKDVRHEVERYLALGADGQYLLQEKAAAPILGASIAIDVTRLVELEPGAVVLTGTPAGVGPVAVGDRMDAKAEGFGAPSGDGRIWPGTKPKAPGHRRPAPPGRRFGSGPAKFRSSNSLAAIKHNIP